MKTINIKWENDPKPTPDEVQVSPVKKVLSAMPVTEEACFRARRSLGTPLLTFFDPFLLLDEFHTNDPGNQQNSIHNHPHRGFEILTYVLSGSVYHSDQLGNNGIIRAGGLQWLTVGSGIIHSERLMPENGTGHGLQLWINLAAKDKMKSPFYRNYEAGQIPEILMPNSGVVRVISGKAMQMEGVVNMSSDRLLLLDVSLPQFADFFLDIPAANNTMVYLLEGEACFGKTVLQNVSAGELGVLGPGNAVNCVTAEKPGRFLLASGKPFEEPVVKYGPFVMNTEEEIQQAIRDFKLGKPIE